MPGLTLYSGNRLEILTDKFAEIVSSAPLSVFTKETIVLQSMGMMKWLTVEMSRRLGLWSNYEYYFPNKMAGKILNSFLPGSGDERYFDRDIMTFRCAGIILEERNNPLFSDLSVYIKNDTTGIKLYQIASKIIDLFDQYLTFRPEMIIDWDNGAMKEEWQAEIWRMLTKGMAGEHPPALLYKIYSLLGGEDKFTPVNLPDRISVFGISYLPVYHLNILRAASLYSDVNLFILNPSPEYWGNILTEKEKRRIISTSPIIPGDPEEYLHTDQGNTLLASLGRVGRDFLFNILMSDLDTEGFFAEPERKSLLTMIQNDIYTMNEVLQKGLIHVFTEDQIIKDASITINSCHSPMRETEVLHDYILDLLSKDKTLAPGDILVMSPDIEEYTGSIQGIFGNSGGDIPHIPFRIVDRKLKNSSVSIETFFKILALGDGRFTASHVLSIAECEEIRKKFDLSREDVNLAARWVREARVFWGIDASYKEELGLPGVAENTWSFGFCRMLMGGIMGPGEKTSLGILPYHEIEGGDLQVLGRFISLFNSLRDIYYMIKNSYTLAEWSGIIIFILNTLFIAGDIPSGFSSIVAAADKFKSMQCESGFAEKVSVKVIIEYFDRILSEAPSGMNFVSGSLTFCEMLPMRSIPCRVICILGMNDSAFPRKSRSLSFDLTSGNPRRGDRSVRDEDRYLFLETLVSARERLFISYIGRSMNGNNRLNPSVVVNELLEYIDQNYFVETTGKKVSEYVVKEHRIQPFNPVYFIDESGFFTYRMSRVEGAQSYASGEKHDYIFMNDKPLPPLSDDEKTISISDLAAFLNNPSRALLNKRLGLYLELKNNEFTDGEPFIPDTLEMYKLNGRIMESLLNCNDKESYFDIVKASGVLPHGTPGLVVYDRCYFEVDNFYRSFSPVLEGKAEKINLNLGIKDFTLTGSADNIYGKKNIFFRYAMAKGMDIFYAWITHLALCTAGSFSGDTYLISKTGIQSWETIPNPEKILSDLLDIYKEGMIRPIPLFPKSSLVYAETYFSPGKGDPGGRAIKKAGNVFNGRYGGNDLNDPYISKLFGNTYTITSKFCNLALKVYSPVFENMKKGWNYE